MNPSGISVDIYPIEGSRITHLQQSDMMVVNLNDFDTLR
jgi:hypothetical protein